MDDDQIPVEYGGTMQNFSWHWPQNYDEYNSILQLQENSETSNNTDAS
jgi:hypothetical protein